MRKFNKKIMPILKYEFCAPSEAFLFLPSLEQTYICLFLL